METDVGKLVFNTSDLSKLKLRCFEFEPPGTEKGEQGERRKG